MKTGGRVAALAGIVCALSFIVMLLTVVPAAEIALPALSGALLMLLVIELGLKWGFMGYAVVAILSLLLAPSLESRMLFVLFFGYYPVLKAALERLRSRVLCWVLKLALFNIAVGGGYYLLMRVLTAVDPLEFTLFGIYLPGVFLLAGNMVFLLYDIGLTRWVGFYLRVWQPRLHKMLRF